MLPTRAWQLAAGGLLALGALLLGRVPLAIAATVGWLGAALLGGKSPGDRPHHRLSGFAALLPTGGLTAAHRLARRRTTDRTQPHLTAPD